MLTKLPQILLATTMILAVGCDDRATRIALQSADQQALQNLAMAQVNEHVADSVKQLLAADANSRRELLAAHRQLLMASNELAEQLNHLELQRRQLADIRRQESLLVPLAHATGGFLLILTVLGFCWHAIASVRAPSTNGDVLEEFLIQEVTGGEPRLLTAGLPPNSASRIDSFDAS